MKTASIRAVVSLLMLPGLAWPQVWPTTKWAAECIPGEECGLEEDATSFGIIIDQLEQTSVWFEDLKFASPHLLQSQNSSDERWLVLFAKDRVDMDVTPQAGIYWRRGKTLEFASPETLLIEQDEDGDGSPETDYTSLPAHELFHAVQASYEWYPRVADEWKWVTEGTASAVESVLGSTRPARFRPQYDYPLDKLETQRGFDPYAAYQFWLFLGNRFGSEPPIEYLADLFENISPGESIASVEDGLEALGENGFWDLYPEFISNFSSHTNYKKIPSPMRIRARRTQWDRWEQKEGDVDRLAAAYQKVIVESVGRDGGLVEIELMGDDVEALHLVVDDKVITGEESGEKNVYRTFMPEPDELVVRVVNVAYPAEQSEKQRYTLRARFLHEFAYLGTEGGSGPSGDDIDAPLPFELPNIKQALIMPGPLEQHVEAGLTDVCILQFQFANPDTGDGIVLKMDTVGPVRPGRYYVHPGGSYDTEDFPGEVATLFGIGAGNPMGMGWSLSYKGVSGFVTLDSVSKHFVKGSATIQYEYGSFFGCIDPQGRKPSLENRIECPELLKNIVIRTEFAVQPHIASGSEILGKSIDQCTGERPVGGSTATPPTGTSSPSPTSSVTPPPPPPPPGAEDGSAALALPGSTLPGQPEFPGAESNPISGGGEGHRIDESAARWFRVRASGDIDTVVAVQDFELAGNCSGSSPLGVGFFQGNFKSDDYAYVEIETAGVVATGETGVFDLKEIKWDYGTIAPDHLPAELNIRGPNRFISDNGTLELTTHNAVSGQRRMRGVIRGTGLTNKAGQATDIDVQFQVDWSCGIQ